MTVLERQDRNCYGRKIRPSTWQSSSIVEIPRQTPASAGVWFTLLAKSRIVGAPNSRIYIPLLRGVFLTQSTFHFGEQVGEKKIEAHVTSCEFSVKGKSPSKILIHDKQWNRGWYDDFFFYDVFD